MIQRSKKIGQGCLMALGVLFLIVLVILIIDVSNDETPATVASVPTFTATPKAAVLLPTVTPELPTPTSTLTPAPPTTTPTPTRSQEEIKAAAIALPPYKDILRHVESYQGQFVYFQGEVVQVLDDHGVAILRVQAEPGYAIYTKYFGKERFLKTDVVAVWGTIDGIESALTVRLVQVEEPRVIAKFIELLSE